MFGFYSFARSFRHYCYSIQCSILSFQGSDYEECWFLGYDAMWLLWEPTFRRNGSPPSSGRTSNWSMLWRNAFLRSRLQLLVIANAVPSSLIHFTLMMEATCSSDLVLTRATWHHIPEDGILLIGPKFSIHRNIGSCLSINSLNWWASPRWPHFIGLTIPYYLPCIAEICSWQTLEFKIMTVQAVGLRYMC
jgi:hypothetical protein